MVSAPINPRATYAAMITRMDRTLGKMRTLLKELKLYNLKSDIAESQDVFKQHPEVVAEIEKLVREAHTPNKMFPMGALEKE